MSVCLADGRHRGKDKTYQFNFWPKVEDTGYSKIKTEKKITEQYVCNLSTIVQQKKSHIVQQKKKIRGIAWEHRKT